MGHENALEYIVMEYIDGITLKEYIEQIGLVPWRECVHYTIQILRALQLAHDRGIVHRDIKPQNVMRLSDGTIKVMDFGIARFSRQNPGMPTEKTMGSVHYVSPEQARGEHTDERSDIYSVGVMMYEMLTGRKPFDGDTPVSVALKHMNEEPVKPSQFVSSMYPGLEEIILRAMEKDPSKRYQSASGMIMDIEAFKKAHAQREYGFRPEDNRMAFLDELEKAVFFFDGALVTSGRRNPAWGTTAFTLMELPDKTKPGAWSELYKDKIAQAKIEAGRYEKIVQGIRTAEAEALRNRYTLQVYEQTNNLQNYPVRLILALNAYDTAKDDAAREAALEKVAEECSYFDVMRSNLESVYSETRFMEQPEGFISDLNHHNHLASKTNNSDWWYYYEIPMVKKVRAWMK